LDTLAALGDEGGERSSTRQGDRAQQHSL